MSRAEGGPASWLGVGLDRWIELFNKVGVSTLLIGWFCAMAWYYLPPVIDGHVELLGTTRTALKSLTATSEAMEATLTEIVRAEHATAKFIDDVRAEHVRQIEALDTLVEACEQQRTKRGG